MKISHQIVPLLAIASLLFAPTIHARISVVTLPNRDTVQLTIYNSADLTLVKETRHLTFRRGMNKLEFSWANTLIDPTSVEFRALSHGDEVELLDVSFPPRVQNTLEWRINSEVAGEVAVEIRYFTSGISWSADYVAEASQNERQMALSSAVRVNNNSGEDYENAQIRLVVGVIRLVEDIANLARAGKPGMPTTVAAATAAAPPPQPMRLMRAFGALAEADVLAAARPKEIVKEGVSEYFMYTVEGRDTIPNGWSKRLPSFKADEVPLTSYYKFEKERWGDKVVRYYQFTNSSPAGLGKEPLPDGAVKALRFVSNDRLYAFVGRTSVKYIPIGESVELELGPDEEVSIQARLMDWQKVDLQFDQHGNVKGWTARETWEIEVQNSKEIPVMVDIRRNFAGDWTLTTEATYERVDATKVKFAVALDPRTRTSLTYQVTTRHGTNATR